MAADTQTEVQFELVGVPECMQEETPIAQASLEVPQNEVMVFDMSTKPTKGKKTNVPAAGKRSQPERNPIFNDREEQKGDEGVEILISAKDRQRLEARNLMPSK